MGPKAARKYCSSAKLSWVLAPSPTSPGPSGAIVKSSSPCGLGGAGVAGRRTPPGQAQRVILGAQGPEQAAWPTGVPWRKLVSVTAAAKKILEDALALTDDERLELMAALSDSFEPQPTELSPEWKAEIEDRIGQLERGEVEPVAWEQVEATIRATLARH